MLFVQVEFEVQMGHSGKKTGKVGWSPAKVDETLCPMSAYVNMVLTFPLRSDTGEHGSFLLFHSLFLSLKFYSHFHIHQIGRMISYKKTLPYNKLIEEYKSHIGARLYLSLWKSQFMQQEGLFKSMTGRYFL